MLRANILSISQTAVLVTGYDLILDQFDVVNDKGEHSTLDAELLLNGLCEYDAPEQLVGRTLIVDLTAEVTLH